MLTKADLRKRVGEGVEVEVPGEGGTILVRLLSFADVTRPKKGETDAQVLARVLVEPQMSLKEIEGLALSTVKNMTEAVMTANGIGENTTPEDLEKN